MAIQPGERSTPDETTPATATPDPTSGDASPATASSPSMETPPSVAGGRVPSTRVGTMWVALCTTAVVFVALIVFLLQNTGRTQVSFLWMEGSAPLAVMLLIAAVGAALITALLGTVRITQLRRLSRRRTVPSRRPT